MRVVIVRGPHKDLVLDHNGGPFLAIRAEERGLLERLVDRVRRRPQPGPPVLYRVFSKALAGDARADVYAAEWCAVHDAFRDRCPCEPVSATRVWVRFAAKFDQTKLEAGAPATRESKWHCLRNDRQVAEPWVTIPPCNLIVYQSVIEEYRHPVLTPIGSPMCRNCKRGAGVEERSQGAGVVLR